ncbi:MAG TPA: thiamine ABC transporter substrate-binding protein [Candidatus Cloacimonadota bacterium]|nr:thiamine ABC transporter substrate-binding protein [Candidatus Cloacimonadota bacterium]HPS39220.1 thiamine ABC transporter substrate-binding protein [Candidatus Cloacimonadota bacterium]
MKHYLIPILALLLCFGACGKKAGKPAPAKPKKTRPLTTLTVYSTDRYRSSGLEKIISDEFFKRTNCRVTTVICGETGDLIRSISTVQDSNNIDLVLGITNSFAYNDTLLNEFMPISKLGVKSLDTNAEFDPGNRLIPYGFSYLSLIYNTAQISEPPLSFGSLQGSEYISQMAVCDPNDNGLGRAMLLWTRALVGESGYKPLWNTLKKSCKLFPTFDEALTSLRSGRYSMFLSYHSLSAWLKEQDPEHDTFKSQILQEGSFRYIEAVGIHKRSANPALAREFIEYLLSPSAQQMVMYKLGLSPANSKTPLPQSFARIPLYSYSVDDRLTQQIVGEGIKSWLEFWNSLFNTSYLP